jgi:hypothetical protein
MPLSPPWTLTDEAWLDHIYIDMSRRREHALISHLETLLLHLLKWRYHPYVDLQTVPISPSGCCLRSLYMYNCAYDGTR